MERLSNASACEPAAADYTGHAEKDASDESKQVGPEGKDRGRVRIAARNHRGDGPDWVPGSGGERVAFARDGTRGRDEGPRPLDPGGIPAATDWPARCVDGPGQREHAPV